MMTLVPNTSTVRGSGNRHFLLVPGLVPDGPETFWRQQRVLRKFGWTTTMTYPNQGFDVEITLQAIRDFITSTRAQGRAPVLVGVSVGGGLCLEALRRARAAGEELPLAGLILISPFSCVDDLAPLLKRLLQPIIAEVDKADGNPQTHVARGRAFFKSLAAKALRPKGDAPKGMEPPLWRQLFSLLTPSGFTEFREARIRRRIEATLDHLPDQGAIGRVVALRHLLGPSVGPHADKPLTSAPTMILWGSKERHTLNMEGPGTAILCRPDLAWKVLPNVEIHWVYDHDGSEVPHASLLKHSRPFNTHLRRFLKRTSKGHAINAAKTALIAPLAVIGLARW